MKTIIVPVLDAAEETDLACRMEAGALAASVLAGERPAPCRCEVEELRFLVADGRAAREQLILANTGLIGLVVRREAHLTGDPDDAWQAGFVGLLEAADRYDHVRSNRFATYALTWIRNQVRAVLRGQECGLIPARRIGELRQIRFAQSRLMQSESRSLTMVEAAELAGLSPRLATDAAVLGTVEQLDDAGVETLVCAQEAEDEWTSVIRVLPHLDQRQREFCRLRYGFGCPPAALREIATDWGWSTAAVHRFEQKLLDELRGAVQLPDAA